MKRGFLLDRDGWSPQSNGPSPFAFGAGPNPVRTRGSQPAWGSQSSWIRQSPETPWVDIGNTASTTCTPNTTTPTSTVVSTTSLDARPNNPYKGQPFIPINIGSPKACLSGNWYGQKPRSHQLSDDNYVTWHDGGMPHNRKYTSLFVCPLTGEVFSSGTYGEDETAYTVQADEAGVDVVWYKKRLLAEHGAAARAYDCFSYRHYFSTSTLSVRSGTSHPYLEPDRISELDPDHPDPPCPQMPPEVEQQVSKLQQQVEVVRDDRTEAMVGVEEDQGPQTKPTPTTTNTGPPGAILQGWYSQKPRSHQLSKENYISWGDGGMAHNLKYTCIFVCPLTGQVFSSGTYGNDETAYTVKTDADGVDVVWYKKKKLAEHGAAARAYDYFSYRQCQGTSMEPVRLGTSPVGEPCCPPKPPPLLEEQVLVLQQQAAMRGGSVTGEEWQASMLSQSEATYNAEYKQTRKMPPAMDDDNDGE